MCNNNESYILPNHQLRSINGSIVGSNTCVGFCQYYNHPGYLTQKQCKQHNCAEKGCCYFTPKIKEKHQPKEKDYSKNLLSLIEKYVNYEGVKILRIEGEAQNQYTVFFVTITNVFSFNYCIERIKEELGIVLSFKQLNYDFDVCASLLYGSKN